MSDVRARVASAYVLIDKEGQMCLYSDVVSVCARVCTCSSTHPRTEMLLY
jgi:hypothetical protein